MTFEIKDTVNPRKAIEFVLATHNDFDKVKELLNEDPRLINASVDMGDGDWETGLDASAHMGRKDIARYLIEQGARFDFLCLMVTLDEVEIVKAILSAFPTVVNRRGVHGFGLRHFAKKGQATRVLAYLDRLEEADN